MRATQIVGYTYQADTYTPEGIVEALIANRELSPAARDMRVEDALDQAAEASAIDRQDESSFDSGDFPKVVFAYQMALDETVILADGSYAVYSDTL